MQSKRKYPPHLRRRLAVAFHEFATKKVTLSEIQKVALEKMDIVEHFSSYHGMPINKALYMKLADAVRNVFRAPNTTY